MTDDRLAIEAEESEPLSEAEIQSVLEGDNDELICSTLIGHALIYHEGLLGEDRERDPVVHSRALTARGLWAGGYVHLRQKRESSTRYIYSLIPYRKITVADCVRQREGARENYESLKPETPAKRRQKR